MHGSQRVLTDPQEQLARCLAEAPLGAAGGPVQPEVSHARGQRRSTTWPLGGPAGETKKLVMQQHDLGGRAAGPNGLPWRPDIPSRSACEEGDSSTFFAVGPGRRSRCFSAVGKIGPTEAVRPDTRSARGELMESPGSRPTRLCRTEGSASSTQSKSIFASRHGREVGESICGSQTTRR